MAHGHTVWQNWCNTNWKALSEVERMRLDYNVCALSVWCKNGWDKCFIRCKQRMSWGYGSPKTRRVKLKNSPADVWSQQLDRKTIQSAEPMMLIAIRLREIPGVPTLQEATVHFQILDQGLKVTVPSLCILLVCVVCFYSHPQLKRPEDIFF